MPNQTDLLNIALGMVGARRISAIDDGSENANQCLTFYPSILDAALRVAHWNFATGRAILAQITDVDAPLFEYTYAWAVPSDFIKLREFYDNLNPANLVFGWEDFNYGRYRDRFRLETFIPIGAPDDTPPVKIFVSNGLNAQIVYTRRVTNPDLWDGQFFWYVAKWLASELAKAISHDSKKAAELMQEAQAYLSMAAAADGQEQSVEPIRVNDLLWGR